MTVARMMIYLCFPAGTLAPAIRKTFPAMLLLIERGLLLVMD